MCSTLQRYSHTLWFCILLQHNHNLLGIWLWFHVIEQHKLWSKYIFKINKILKLRCGLHSLTFTFYLFMVCLCILDIENIHNIIAVISGTINRSIFVSYNGPVKVQTKLQLKICGKTCCSETLVFHSDRAWGILQRKTKGVVSGCTMLL